jgi:integrase
MQKIEEPMPTISGEGYVSKCGHNRYYMFLVIDGQKVRRPTGTEDHDEAVDKLNEWKAQVKVGVVNKDSRLRYEDIRGNYLAAGKQPEAKQLEDLDSFFWKTKDASGQFKKNTSVYISAITPTFIKKFREWRESLPQVTEYKQETLQKEIALRKLRASENDRRKLSAKQIQDLEAEAQRWVENGVKATTNRRLTVLRAMFNHAAKEELVRAADVPASFCLWENVDNVKTGKFTEEQFDQILKQLAPNLRSLVEFLYSTGMGSGQARKITWNMIDQNQVLTIPGLLTKNKKPYTLPLLNSKGKPYSWTEAIVNQKKRPHGEPVFDDTNLRIEWQRACHKLGLGIFDEKTRMYRGASLHDFRRTAVSNMNAKGIHKNAAMAISGHKTDSMYSRYGIEDIKTVQTALDIMSD